MDPTREAQWRTQFNEQGYFVVPDVLGTNELAHFRTVIDGLIERSRQVTRSDAVFDLEPDHSATRPRVRRIKAAHRVDPVFAEFMHYPRVTEILTTLLGPHVRHQYIKLNTKAAGVASGLGLLSAHQRFGAGARIDD